MAGLPACTSARTLVPRGVQLGVGYEAEHFSGAVGQRGQHHVGALLAGLLAASQQQRGDGCGVGEGEERQSLGGMWTPGAGAGAGAGSDPGTGATGPLLTARAQARQAASTSSACHDPSDGSTQTPPA